MATDRLTAGGLEERSRPRPLQDVRVLDVSRVVAGPFAGRLLADLGADVVKIEPPAGDATRAYGQVKAGLSGSFSQQNVGKRNICVDLKAPGGVDLVLRLAASADLMLENFRPGVLDRLGLGWKTLSAVNPKLILLSLTGFGQTGPDAGRRAYAPVIHAETGLVARQAAFDARPPSDPMPSIADTNASLHGVVAALAALHLRHATGRGQHIDVSMAEAMLATDDYSHHALDEFGILRVGGDVWQAPGGALLTAGLFSNVWGMLRDAQVVDEPGGADADSPEATRRRMAAVQTWMASFADRASLIEALESAGVAWADVCEPMEVFNSRWARARRAWAEVDDRNGGVRRIVQTPYRFSDADSGVRGRVSHRGEDNAHVLRDWLGLDSREVQQLIAGGVLQTDGRGAAAGDSD
ncbi:CoA transferase [bacterium]|nr:MAG: CoA transferase [bacterium]